MRVLVSGATGAVGRAFTRAALLKTSHELVLLSRQPESLGPLRARHPQRVSTSAPESGAAWGSLDACIHLAASLDYHGPWPKLVQANVRLTENLYHRAVSSGAKRFVFASSIEAVGPGRTSDCPIPEETPLRPRSRYGLSKRLAEETLRQAARARGGRAVCARIGNVYGPDAPSFLDSIQALLAGQNASDAGNLLPAIETSTLHPIHADDAAAGLLALLETDAPQDVYNLCGPQAATVRQILEFTGHILDRPLPPTKFLSAGLRIKAAAHRTLCRLRGASDFTCYALGEAGNRVHRRFAMDRIKRDIGFEPRIELKPGLADALRPAALAAVNA